MSWRSITAAGRRIKEISPEDHDRLKQLYRELDVIESDLIDSRFELGKSIKSLGLSPVARAWNTSRQNVLQFAKSCLTRMRPQMLRLQSDTRCHGCGQELDSSEVSEAPQTPGTVTSMRKLVLTPDQQHDLFTLKRKHDYHRAEYIDKKKQIAQHLQKIGITVAGKLLGTSHTVVAMFINRNLSEKGVQTLQFHQLRDGNCGKCNRPSTVQFEDASAPEGDFDEDLKDSDI